MPPADARTRRGRAKEKRLAWAEETSAARVLRRTHLSEGPLTWLRTAAELHASALSTGLVFGLPLALWFFGTSVPVDVELVEAAAPRVVAMTLPAPPPPAVDEPAPAEEAGAAPEPSAQPSAPAAPPTESTVSSRRVRAETVSEAAVEVDKPKKRRRVRRRNCDQDSPAIAKLDDGTIRVERDLVQYYARHLKALDELGYTYAYKDDAGRAVGLRVGGFTCNNVAVQAGLKNGDVIQAVNGKPVKSLAGAVWLYLRMKGKEDITLTVVRRGQEMSLNYKLV